jgi:hypothetical protein
MEGSPTLVEMARFLIEQTGDLSKSVEPVIEMILKRQITRGTESTQDERDALDILYGYIETQKELRRRAG